MNIDGNPNYPVGTGGFQDFLGGVAQPANYFGNNGWLTVPTSWYSRVDSNNQVWVSPNPDFSTPQYACKTNQDGSLVFQDVAQKLYGGPLSPG